MRNIALMGLAGLIVASPAAAVDFTITGTSLDGPTHYARIESTGSSGSLDSGVIRFTCDRGVASDARLRRPRDVSDGKRTHKPWTILSWKTVPPGHGSWDLATSKGARSSGGTTAMDDWTAITVTGLDEVCAASSKVNVQDLSITK